MYDAGFIAHNILCTASQDKVLLVKCKIPYVNCASRYSIRAFEMAGFSDIEISIFRDSSLRDFKISRFKFASM
jgi:hypothetical protein